MRTLPFVLLWVVTRAVGAFGQAFSVGNDNWGLQLILDTPRECQALRMYYNVGAVSGAPDNTKWPDEAYIRFLTPESAEREWMVCNRLRLRMVSAARAETLADMARAKRHWNLQLDCASACREAVCRSEFPRV